MHPEFFRSVNNAIGSDTELLNMFAKKKKKVEISAPTNFQHRVHTGFDQSNNKFVGLPLQWASIVKVLIYQAHILTPSLLDLENRY